jgi:Cu/Ag efflux protein CusF
VTVRLSIVLLLFGAGASAASGCSRKRAAPTTAQASQTPASTQPASPPSGLPSAGKPLPLAGTIEKVDQPDGMLTVQNENVPGWGMPPMTMSYHVSNPEILGTAKVGERVTASVYAGDFGKLYDVRLVVAKPVSTESALPPLSYVCPTAGEENEIGDQPGTCKSSPAKLVPVRLVIAYECLKGPSFIQGTQGICRYDKSELAPITAAMFWACGDDAGGQRYLEPGRCTDGSAREERFEKRPHGDHNPRHGGPYVAMSQDLLHHSEGTLVAPGNFRAYFYDEYTRPMSVTGYSARIVPTDSNAKEIGQPILLTPAKARGPNVMEAHVPGPLAPSSAAPLHFKLHVAVNRAAKDWTSDWDFTHFSIEPGVPPQGTAAVPVSAAASLPASPRETAAPPAAPTAPAAGSSAAVATTTAMGGGAVLAGGGPAVQQDPLPTTTAGLLKELTNRVASVDSLLSDGNLGGLWLDALRSKDLAIALEQQHAGDVPETARPTLASDVKKLTESAWQIDAAGDLGQRDKIVQLHAVFAASAAEIESLYGSPR